MRLPVHLGRRPPEPSDPAIQEFYGRLLEVLARSEVRDGRWQLLESRRAWDVNRTWKQFIVFAWETGPGADGRESPDRRRLLIAVNYGPATGQCYVPLPFGDLRGRKFLLRDLTSPARYERNGDELASRGLYLDMPEWGYHVFEMTVV